MTELGSSSSLSNKIPALATLIAPIVFQAIFRKRGGFIYRQIVAIILIAVSAGYGMLASLILPVFGKTHLISYSVGRVEAFLSKTFLAITATVEGQENLAKVGEPAIYVANHQTLMDISYMGCVFPKGTSIMAKRSIKYYPVLGWFMMLSNAIFMDRGNRTNAINQAKKAAEDMYRKKTSVWVYPEGTRSNADGPTLLPFKKGAFYMAAQAKAPIIPIVIENYKDIYNVKAKRFTHGDIKIKILPPVPTKDISPDSESIDKLTNSVRDSMLAVLEEISTDKAKLD